jgi:predicted Rossmann fold flavoprotein
MPDSHRYDTIIIGGGPAGIMAAISAKRHHPGRSVVILDRTTEAGRKILVSGNGRANLTNRSLATDLPYHGDGQFVSTVFSGFGYDRIVGFFADLGVALYEEKKTGRGKMFPVIDHARTIRGMLIDELEATGVGVVCNAAVAQVLHDTDGWTVTTAAGDRYTAGAVILSTGGRTYPALGSDGSGYDLARRLGHRLVEPVPSAVPLVSKNMLSHLLQGEKMIMEVTATVAGTACGTATGDVMFTQYGLSGPAVFDVSRDLSVRINRESRDDTAVVLSFFPGMGTDELGRMLNGRLAHGANRPAAHALWGVLTEKAAGAVCAASQIPRDRMAGQVTPGEVQRLTETLLRYCVPVSGTRGWNEAEFTAGGIATEDVDARTLGSKLAPGLYFAGEILDVDGPVGGFNLSWAWATGWLAGKAAGM